MARATE